MCPLIAPPPTLTPGTIQYQWVNWYGAALDLTWATSPTVFVQQGSIGLGSVGNEIADEKLPTGPGTVVRQIRTPAVRIELPIRVIMSSFQDVILTLDALRGWFDTGDENRRTPGYLRITRPDGTVRQIQCYYAGGLEGDLSKGGPISATYVVSLYAPDPGPTATAETVTTWTATDLPNVGQVNEGQMDAYPRWKVTGPATQINVANVTTGKNWSLTYSLAAGKYVMVDTRPPSQRTVLPVLDSDGVSRFPALFAGSQVFGNWLAPGANTFLITLLGTSGATRVELRYLPRYRGMVR